MNWTKYISRGVAAILFFFLSVMYSMTNGQMTSCKVTTEFDVLKAIAVIGMLISVGWFAGYEHRREREK